MTKKNDTLVNVEDNFEPTSYSSMVASQSVMKNIPNLSKTSITNLLGNNNNLINKPQPQNLNAENLSSKKSYASIACSNSTQQQQQTATTSKTNNKNIETLENSNSSPIQTTAQNPRTTTTTPQSSSNVSLNSLRQQTPKQSITNLKSIAQIPNPILKKTTTTPPTSTTMGTITGANRTYHNTNIIKKNTSRSNSNDNIENNTNLAASYNNNCTLINR